MRRQNIKGKQGTVRNFRQVLESGGVKDWMQGGTKRAEGERRCARATRESSGKIRLPLVRNVGFGAFFPSFFYFFPPLRLLFFNCSYSLLLAFFAHSFPPSI